MISLVSVFISGPSISIGPLDIVFFDLICLFLGILSIAHVGISKELVLPIHRVVWVSSFVYFSLAIGLPLVGIVLQNHPFYYFLGDIRWFQALLIGLIMFILYSSTPHNLLDDFTSIMKLTIVIHTFIFILQVLVSNGILDTRYILDIWYYGRSPYGGSGYHLSRYAGAATTASNLGLTAALGTSVFIRSLVLNREGLSFLTISLVLLIASGHRTSFVAVIGIIFVYCLFTARNIYN
jgi:hypothetical protein